MTDMGKANYEAWRKAGGRHGSSSEDLEYDELRSADRHAFDAGACAVEQWLADLPVDEDAPGSEPQPAKVIIVTEAGGRERHYDANQPDTSEYGLLRLLRKGREVAVYQSNAWLSVREDGATVPDPTVRALGIARRALSEIVKRSDDGGEQPFGRPEIGGIASTALNDIWTETEG